MNNDQSDIGYWHAFKGGDREAFDNLFRQYYPILLQYGFRVCPDKNVVDDCIQDLFIELWQSKTSNPIQSVRAYLLKALKYKIFKYLRGVHIIDRADEVSENTGFEISHDDFIITEEEKVLTTKKLIEAVNQLPNRQKEIIYLKIYQALSYEEISEVMNINYQAARNLFYQSIKSLREVLGA